MMQEMQKQLALQPQEISDFAPYFKPELIDTIFNYIKHNNIEVLYDKSDELLKNTHSKADIEKYFKAIKRFYGEIKNYTQETYSIREQHMSANKVAIATYDTEFDNVEVIATLAFTVIDTTTILLQTFRIEVNDYTNIEEFNTISQSTLKLLAAHDYQKLYNSTSERFQAYTSIGKYEEFVKRLKDIDFSKYKQFKNSINIVDNKISLYIMYDIDKQGFLSLTFTEFN